MAYVETLFGHQDEITNLCAMGSKDRCISTGGRDRSVRLWKILEESQLVFRVSQLVNKKEQKMDDEDLEPVNANRSLMTCLNEDNTGSVDSIAFLDDESWITGTDGGALSIWSIQRKKPVFSIPNAHGRYFIARNDSEEAHAESSGCRGVINAENVETTASDIASKLGATYPVLTNPFWITAIASVPHSDLIVTGSWDGQLRFWRRQLSGGGGGMMGEEKPRQKKPLQLINSLPIEGYINSIQFSTSGKYLVVGVGQEHRFGRWQRIGSARNTVYTIDLGNLFTIEK